MMGLVAGAGFEPAIFGLGVLTSRGISLLLQQARQRHTTEEPVRDAQVVLIWYSFFCSSFARKITQRFRKCGRSARTGQS